MNSQEELDHIYAIITNITDEMEYHRAELKFLQEILEENQIKATGIEDELEDEKASTITRTI